MRMTLASPAHYSRSERVVDGAVHIAGLAFALGAVTYLGFLIRQRPGTGASIGLALYGFGMLSMLGCSALYNFAVAGPRKGIFRRMDHAAIFIMIAGTYSPFSLTALQGALGNTLLACLWTAALAGVGMKLVYPGRFERVSIALYLAMGWSGLCAIHWLLAAVPATSLILLGIGGLLYSAGVFFHLQSRLPYHNAIWHMFVLVAVMCHYAAVVGLA